MKIQDAARITKRQVAEELGGLPPAKMHCSVLATDGLKVAIDDYLVKNGREPIAGEILSDNPNFDPHAEVADSEESEACDL